MCPSGRDPARESLASPSSSSSSSRSFFRSAFEVIDADGDGKIGREDLRAFYARGDDAASDESAIIGSMITAADSNADGFVDYEEFERASLGGGGDEVAIMEEVFKAIDRDGDGMLSHDDLKSFMSFAGFDLSDEDIKAMITFANNNTNNNNSGVSFQGLCKILTVDSR